MPNGHPRQPRGPVGAASLSLIGMPNSPGWVRYVVQQHDKVYAVILMDDSDYPSIRRQSTLPFSASGTPTPGSRDGVRYVDLWHDNKAAALSVVVFHCRTAYLTLTGHNRVYRQTSFA